MRQKVGHTLQLKPLDSKAPDPDEQADKHAITFFYPCVAPAANKQIAKTGIACRRGLTVNLLDTQVESVETEQGIAIIPSFGLPAGRSRKVTMSKLADPLVTLEF